MLRNSLSQLSNKHIIIGGIALLVIIWSVIAFTSNSSSSWDFLYTGEVITVQKGKIEEVLSFDGTTAFADSQKLTFWQQGLKVKNVYFKVGDKVRKDQVLATLDSTDLDATFNAAKSNLSLAKLNYDKALASENKEFDLLKAQDDLRIAQNNLDTIETSIQIANNEEDNTLAKAEKALTDATKEYEDLACENCSSADDNIRNRKNTYQDAVQDIKSMINTAQNNIDKLDKIMFFSPKYRMPSSEASVYIGANDTSTITTTARNFGTVMQDIEILEEAYTTLSKISIDEITVDTLAETYQQVDDLALSLTNLGNNARTMFNSSIIGRGMAGQSTVMDQATIDSYIMIADAIYTSGRSISTQSSTTMNKVYKIDDTTNIENAKQTRNQAQVTLDKLKLNKSKRASNNESQRVAARVAVVQAEQGVTAVNKGYNNTTVQNMYNQLVQAQSNFNTARKRYESYQLIANFNGTVTEMNIQIGDTVDRESDTYIYVENPNIMEIDLQVDQIDILKLNRGDEVSITLDIMNDIEFSGSISEINTIPVVKSGKTSYSVKVIAEKPGDTTILGGMSATVKLTTQSKDNAVIVPNTALQYNNNNMYVIKADKTKQLVTIGLRDRLHSEILSGLQAWEAILSIVISHGDVQASQVDDTSPIAWWEDPAEVNKRPPSFAKEDPSADQE